MSSKSGDIFDSSKCSLNFEMYVQIQNLLLFAADKQDYEQELKQVLDFYKDDFDEDGLRLQLKIVSANFPKKCLVK